MFRAYWRRPRFWIWWFKRGAPSELRWGLGLFAVVAVLGGGYLAADRLSAASAVSSGGAAVGADSANSRPQTAR